jgi:hypothetical protein
VEPTAITNARRLYDSCIDEYTIDKEGLYVIRSLVNQELGGWPNSTGSTWDESMFDLSDRLLKLNQYNKFVFYHVETTIGFDHFNKLRYRIRVSI